MSPSTVPITITVPARLLRWAEAELRRDGENRSAFFTRLLREAFDAAVDARQHNERPETDEERASGEAWASLALRTMAGYEDDAPRRAAG